MEILNQKWRVETTTYLNLIEKFDGEIGLDDSFNVGSLTEGRWESRKAIGFIRSVIRGIAMQDIYLVDLQSCLDNSVEGSEDWEYFKKWLDAGYKWLAVDGNNRTITCRNFFNDNIKIPSGEKFEVEVCGQKAKFKIKKGQNVWSNLPEELKKVIRMLHSLYIRKFPMKQNVGHLDKPIDVFLRHVLHNHYMQTKEKIKYEKVFELFNSNEKFVSDGLGYRQYQLYNSVKNSFGTEM